MRPDRVGSRIEFKDHNDSTCKGKITHRKDDGSIIVVCLNGPNQGNTKRIDPDDIVYSSAAPEIQEMIEGGEDSEEIINEVMNEGIFRDTYMLSNDQVQKVIDHLEDEIPNFRTETKDGTVWGFVQGDEEAIFKYNIPSGEMSADFPYRKLLKISQDELR